MWVCASTPPGITYAPVASMTRSAFSASPEPGASSATTRSPSTSTSAVTSAVAETTSPPLINVVLMRHLRWSRPVSGKWSHRTTYHSRGLSCSFEGGDEDGGAVLGLVGGEGERRGDAQDVAVQAALADQQAGRLGQLEDLGGGLRTGLAVAVHQLDADHQPLAADVDHPGQPGGLVQRGAQDRTDPGGVALQVVVQGVAQVGQRSGGGHRATAEGR